MLIVRGRERERDKERLCAAAARSRIHGFAKSLLTTESTDWEGLYCTPFFIVCIYICVCSITMANLFLFFFENHRTLKELQGLFIINI